MARCSVALLVLLAGCSLLAGYPSAPADAPSDHNQGQLDARPPRDHGAAEPRSVDLLPLPPDLPRDTRPPDTKPPVIDKGPPPPPCPSWPCGCNPTLSTGGKPASATCYYGGGRSQKQYDITCSSTSCACSEDGHKPTSCSTASLQTACGLCLPFIHYNCCVLH